MKYIIFLLLPFNLVAQRHRDSTGIFPYENKKIHITGVVQLDSSHLKKVLFDNSVIWFARATNDFNNQLQHPEKWGLKDNIIIKDEAIGELSGTLRINVKLPFGETLASFDAFVWVKNGRYKYDFTNYKYINNNLSDRFISPQNTSNDLELYDYKNYKNFLSKLYIASMTMVNNLMKLMATKSIANDF